MDTNTVDDLSVTCVLRGKPEYGPDGNKKGIRFHSRPYLIFRGQQILAEQSAWREIIVRELSAKDGDIGIVVDSDLSRLASYNSRSAPIIDNFYLPERVQLIYASADVGKEHIINKVMSQTYKAASKMIQKIRNGEVIVP